MDRHVRWFRREIAVGVARRLTAESAIFSALILGGLLMLKTAPIVAVLGAAVALPLIALVRVGIALASNPMSSTYLVRWPQPPGTVVPIPQSNVDSPTDLALRSFAFTSRGAFEEWGGATTNVYTRESNQIVVTTSNEGDMVIISALDDDRLVLTTTQFIPPHERLIINRQTGSDIRAILASHIELMKQLTTVNQQTATTVGIHEVLDVLAIEWDAWDQIGPLLGPFVAVGQRRAPAMLHIRVPALDVLERTSAPAPRLARVQTTAESSVPAPMRAPLPAITVTAPIVPKTVVTPPPIPPRTGPTPPPVHVFSPATTAEAA